jgi:3-hydroxyisobutyrate dehydrogenase
MTAPFRVGFVGVGLMGHGIARNLLEAEHTLSFLDHPGNQPTEDLRALGADSQTTLADTVRDKNVVLLCVTGTPEVEAVTLADGGLVDHLAPDTIVVDCSTAQPDSTLKVAARIKAAGAHYLDAPMTRTPKEAEAGKLNLMVGGETAVLDQIRPLLSAFAENIYHVGPTGSGHRMKLLHNFVSIGFTGLLAEATACAQSSGVDLERFVQVLDSGGGHGVVLDRLTPYILAHDYGAFRFSISNCHKDLSYYTHMADSMGLASIGAHALEQVFALAKADGAGEQPAPTLIDWLSGTPLRDKG